LFGCRLVAVPLSRWFVLFYFFGSFDP
jgi:hypothetical protein